MRLFGPVFVIIFVCYLIAWVMAMLLTSKAAKAKGYRDIQAQLWFIGLFAFPFTPCLIVAALPDKSKRNDGADLPAI